MTDRPPTPALSRRSLLTGGAAALGGAFLLPGLTGCASAAGADPLVQLKFWHLLSGGDGITMNTMVETTNRELDGVHTTQTVLAWGTPYYTKLAMASAGGRAPDVAIMHAARVPGYAPGGLLDPWDLDRLAAYGVTKDDFTERIWAAGTSDGEVYSLALDSHPFILMYNTEIAEKAGALGPDGLLRETNSPEEFVDLALAIQSVTGVHGLSYGHLNDGPQMWRLWYTLYKQHGAEMSLPEGGEIQLDMDAAISSLEFVQTLLDGTIATPTGDYGTAVSEFLSGDSGLFFSGVWELPTMINNGLPVDATPIPTLFGTPAAYADSHSFVLPHQANPDEAKREDVYAFVGAMFADSLVWADGGHIPAFQPVATSTAYAELLPQAHYAKAADILNYDPPAWFTGSGSDFQTYFAESLQGVFLGRDDPRAGMESFVRRINVLLSKPNPVG